MFTHPEMLEPHTPQGYSPHCKYCQYCVGKDGKYWECVINTSYNGKGIKIHESGMRSICDSFENRSDKKECTLDEILGL